MIPLIYSLIFTSIIILQTTFFKMFGSLSPDAILLIAIYCGLRFGKIKGIQIGVTVGLTQDLLSYGLLGINFLTKGLIGFTSGLIGESNVIIGNSPFMWAILITVSTTADAIFLKTALSGFFDTPILLTITFWNIIFQTLLNLIFGIPFFFLLDIFNKWLDAVILRR